MVGQGVVGEDGLEAATEAATASALAMSVCCCKRVADASTAWRRRTNSAEAARRVAACTARASAWAT